MIRSVQTPNGSWPVGTVEAGLLFQTPRSLRLWDPGARAWVRRLPGLFPAATGANLVASCGGRCRTLAITDAGTGATRRIDPPRGYWFSAGYTNAEFSPDGSLLAAAVGFHRPGTNRISYRRSALALIDLRTGASRLIAGSGRESAVAWSPSGGHLYLARAGGRLMAYRPDAKRARLLARLPVGRHAPLLHLAAL